MPAMAKQTVGRKMTVAAFIMGASILISRLIGFLRERVIANLSGATRETDIYYAAFTIPDFLNYLLASGAISITFIPLFAKYLVDQDEAQGWRVFSVVVTAMGLAMLVLVALGMIFAEGLVPIVAPGFGGAELTSLARIVRIILPAQLFFYLGGVLAAVQFAKERFLFPALAPLVYNTAIILGGVLLAPTLGVEGFAWGVLIGAFFGSFVLQLVGAQRVGMVYRPTLAVGHPAFRRYLLLSLPIMLGLSLTVADEWFLKAFGSQLAEGRISFIQWARTIIRVPVALFGLSAGIAAFPFLSRLAAANATEELERRLSQAIEIVMVLSALSTVLLVLFAHEATYVIFYGWKMTLADVDSTARVLIPFSLMVFAWGVRELIARGFYVRRDMWTPTIVGTAAVIVTVPLYLLMMSHYGRFGLREPVEGLAVASAIGMNIFAVVLGTIYYRRFGWRYALPVLKALRGVAIASVIAFAAGWGAGWILSAAGLRWSSALGVAVRGLVGGTLVTVVFVVSARRLGVVAIDTVWERLAGKLLRRKAGQAKAHDPAE